MRYNNYHKHTHYSNITTLDVITKPEDYMKRAIELQQDTYFTTEHGYTGNIYEARTLCDKYGLKLVVGMEAYYVHNRKENDKSNYHLILISLNKEGYKEINNLLSESNISGFYYKPRIDDELLFSINPNNFIITTACVAGRLRNEENRDEWIKKMKAYFGNNFYLEVQPHIHQRQKEYNKMILEYSNKYNIPIIHANDSHYIYEEDNKYRDLFLKAKGIKYQDEEGFILDYPDTDTIIERYRKQGVLNEEQILSAINNTLVLDKAEDLVIEKDIKVPHVFENPEKELKSIINSEWEKDRVNVKKNRWNEYIDDIREEVDIIDKTNMAQYFLLNYHMIKNAVNKFNGVITKTGRGSAPSFYVNKLLRFTDIDRIDSPITLFPSRFMSVTRILETHSLPDIDFNCAKQEPFYLASKDLLGEDNCWWMISYKPLQNSSAFRLYCKSIDMDINEYNEIAKDLDNYIEDEKWKPIIEASKPFVGVIESISQSPCSTILLDKPISKEIGLLKVGNVICANIDGYNSDVYKYLKNDILAVKVWDIIDNTCKLAGIKIPTITELNKLLDKKTFDIYKNGLTCTINQVDSDYATGLVKEYKPQSVDEMSAFVAALRPGFSSLLNNFIHRQPYTTGVVELDKLLDDSYHYLLYQESIMKYLTWLGIEESETYSIIKKIAKKKFKEKELEELQTKLKSGWINVVGTLEGFEQTWKVVEDASHYSFNASHSLAYAYDSLYGAYLKSHYPLEYYTTTFNFYQDDFERTNKLTNELKYFNIKIENPKFRYSQDNYSCDKNTNTIYKGTSSIKGLSKVTGSLLYKLKDKKYSDFYDFIIDARENKVFIADIIILIKLNFFSEFGCRKKLLRIIDLYNEFNGKKIISKDKEYSVKQLVLKDFCKKETEKQYSGFDSYSCIKYLINFIDNNDEISLGDICKFELEYYGYINTTNSNKNNLWYVTNISKRNKNNMVSLYNLNNGENKIVKIKTAVYNEKEFKKDDILEIPCFSKEGKWIYNQETQKWDKSLTILEDFLSVYNLYK